MGIGTLKEKSLHAALKAFYAQPGDIVEQPINGYVVDIVRPQADNTRQCIEIQTRSLGSMKQKLAALLDKNPILVVHPIAVERFIVRVDQDGVILTRRKSPKHGTIFDVFSELVSIPRLISHPNFALEIALIHEEQLWLNDGQGSWRCKRWSIQDRRLLKVVEAVRLTTAEDFRRLLPNDLSEPFTCRELAARLKQPVHIAQKMAYCLREMGVIQVVGKQGNARLYRVSSATDLT